MNTYRYGLKNCYYCIKGESTPKRLPGAVALNLTANVDIITRTTSDGIEIPLSVDDKGYDGSLELATIPETFLSDIMGIYRDDNNVMCRGRHKIKLFTLLFETKGSKKIRYSLQSCYCNVPDFETSTEEEKPSIAVEKIGIKVIPYPCNNTIIKVISERDNPAVYQDWFKKIY